MEDRTQQINTSDLGLLVFVLVAGWLLLFQSGIFQKGLKETERSSSGDQFMVGSQLQVKF
jgi:hypothetical protein